MMKQNFQLTEIMFYNSKGVIYNSKRCPLPITLFSPAISLVVAKERTELKSQATQQRLD